MAKKVTRKPAPRAKARGRDAAAKAAKPAKKTTKKAAVAGRKGQYVYLFGTKTDGNGSMKPLLGGKGANLAEMTRLGIPVPPWS